MDKEVKSDEIELPIDVEEPLVTADKEAETIKKELSDVINKHCKENDSDTPDYLLAQYLMGCLDNYAQTVKARDKWFSFDPWKEKLWK